MSTPTLPTLPLGPFPPGLLDPVKIAFNDWKSYIQTPPGEFVNVVAFKLILLAHRESVFGYGYLFTVAAADTLTGELRVTDEDMSFNPENGWQGGDHFGSPAPKKVPVTAKLVAGANGHDQIALDLGPTYHATLTATAGKDPSDASALMLTGDRVGTPGGKALATFSKESWEKTHWPPS